MIFPKKEILYAPMLGTLGGGSARGFGRGGGGPHPIGGAVFTTGLSTYTWNWTVPEGVKFVHVVCVGGGGGGCRDGNSNIPTGGGDSWFLNSSTVAGLGGSRGSQSGYSGNVDGKDGTFGRGGSWVGDGGGQGGFSRIPENSPTNGFYSAGGAGGYSGNGGDGGKANGFGTVIYNPGSGSGGGAAGGQWAGGGGVGLYGEGASGAAGTSYTHAGQGGSGGTRGGYQNSAPASMPSNTYIYNGGVYGGGGSGTYSIQGGGGGLGWKNNIAVSPGQAISIQVGAAGQPNNHSDNSGYGGAGGVRVMWGEDRAFPNTNTSLSYSQTEGDGETIY